VTIGVGDALEAPAASPIGAGERLTVWLLSDMLLLGADLGPTVSAAGVGRALGEALGLKLTLDEGADKEPAAFLRVRRTESWHGGWGLPRPSLLAVQAGSCLRFKVERGQASAAQVQRVLERGVGLRTAEGYGQVAFNPSLLREEISAWEIHPSLKKDQLKPATPAHQDKAKATSAPQIIKPGEPLHNFARVLEKEAWRQRIARAATACMTDVEQRKRHLGWTRDKPGNSQLGALRDVVQRVQTDADFGVARAWLEGLCGNNKRKVGWPPGALKKLGDLFIQDEQKGDAPIWEALGDTEAWPTLTCSAMALRAELRAEALRALIDAAMRAHRRADERHASGTKELEG